MQKIHTWKKAAALFLSAVFLLLCCSCWSVWGEGESGYAYGGEEYNGTAGQETPGDTDEDAQAPEKPAAPGTVTLGKTAIWTDPAAYKARIDLLVKGIQTYTQDQAPIRVIPVLDVTGSMACCEDEDHIHPVKYHTIAGFAEWRPVWNIIKPLLPTLEDYTQMGRLGAENLFLNLPDQIDPSHKCRLVLGDSASTNDRDFTDPSSWRVIYVTDDQESLEGVVEEKTGYMYHSIEMGGQYYPLGTVIEHPTRTTWKYTGAKLEDYGCTQSRLEKLTEGYVSFVEALFQNPGAQICPVAFESGYYIWGWTNSREEAITFLTEKNYINAKQVVPEESTATNHEAAVMGAIEAAETIDNPENSCVMIFTDGGANGGYVHSEQGGIDMTLLDPHSSGQAQSDKQWFPTFSQWAVEDAGDLKKIVPVYCVGYGYDMEYNDYSMEMLSQLSSGNEYFIDTRNQDMDSIKDIFRAIYSDMLSKATRVQTVDYVSEYWEVEAESLPLDCKVERIDITNQQGVADYIYKLTFPISEEMGRDDEENFEIPVVLRETYRPVTELTWYETNQDAPLGKDQEGSGGYVTYRDLEEKQQRTDAPTPKLDVYPAQAGLSVEKMAESPKVKAGAEAWYSITVSNQGQPPLNGVIVSDIFEKEEIEGIFEPQEGVEVLEEGTKVRIPVLGTGETVKLRLKAQIPAGEQGILKNTAYASAPDPSRPGSELEAQSQAQIEVEPAPIDYTVEKAADKDKAVPGDTITYTIIIKNTGQREIRSVVTTDKFTEADVKAEFQEQEGVTLNQDRTEASVPSILPGEEVRLTAVAQIPEDFEKEELINMAIVQPEGEEPKQDDVQVKVEQPNPPEPTETPEPSETPLPSTTPAVTQTPAPTATPDTLKGDGNTLKGSSSPKGTTDSRGSLKTGDDTPVGAWKIVAGGTALTAALAAVLLYLRRRKGKRQS